MPAPPVLLGDQLPLPRHTMAAISRRLDAIERVRVARESTPGVPAVLRPQLNWREHDNPTGNPLYDHYRLLLGKSPEILNQFRLYAHFTGYPLRRLLDTGGICEPHWLELYAASIDGVPREYRVNPPPIMGEIGVMIDGVIVNPDTVVYQERISLLYHAGVFASLAAIATTRSPVILEVGSGFGALASHIKRICPAATYICCDIAESLAFAATYLTAACPDHPQEVVEDGAVRPHGQFAYVASHLVAALERSQVPVDLAINTLSLSELPDEQIAHYGSLVSRLLADRGVFFEQNQDNRHVGMGYTKDILSGYFAERVTLPQGTQGSADLWSRARRLPAPNAR
jgi:hypothetical protein